MVTDKCHVFLLPPADIRMVGPLFFCKKKTRNFLVWHPTGRKIVITCPRYVHTSSLDGEIPTPPWAQESSGIWYFWDGKLTDCSSYPGMTATMSPFNKNGMHAWQLASYTALVYIWYLMGCEDTSCFRRWTQNEASVWQLDTWSPSNRKNAKTKVKYMAGGGERQNHPSSIACTVEPLAVGHFLSKSLSGALAVCSYHFPRSI